MTRAPSTPPADAPVQRDLDPAAAAVQRAQQEHDMAAAMGFLGGPASSIDASLVQMKTDAHTGLTDDAISARAAAGVSGAGQSLPHLDAIQRSFGAHDVSGVRAHVGGPAADASHAIGAHGYATGNDVAFASQPDLFLAAHEAAHVVQQRHGVHLKGAVGQDGDAYERHADEVAAAVVRGESAESLLGSGRSGGGGGGGGAIQRKGEAEKGATIDGTEAQQALEAASLAITFYKAKTIPAGYEDALESLKLGMRHDGNEKVKNFHRKDGERLHHLDRAIAKLQPAIDCYLSGDASQKAWVTKHVSGPIERRRVELIDDEAHELIDDAVKDKSGKVLSPVYGDDEGTAETVKAKLDLMMPVAKELDAMIYAEKSVKGALGLTKDQWDALEKEIDVGWFGAMVRAVDAANTVWGAVNNTTADPTQRTVEYIKAGTDALSSGSVVILTIVSGISKFAGYADLGTKAMGAAKFIHNSNHISAISSALDVAIGVFKILNAKTSRDRAEGFTNVISGGIGLGFAAAYLPAGAAASAGGGAMGGGVGLWVAAASALFLGGGDMAGGAGRLGKIQLLETISSSFNSINECLTGGENGHALAREEKEQERKDALERAATGNEDAAISYSRGFLDSCKKQDDWDKALSNYTPGNHPKIRARFAPLVSAGLGTSHKENLAASRKVRDALLACLSSWAEIEADAVESAEKAYYGPLGL